MTHWLSFAALACSLGGNVLVNCRRQSGFVVWIASNMLWIAVNISGEPNWCQVAMFIAYVCLNVQGFVNWGRQSAK